MNNFIHSKITKFVSTVVIACFFITTMNDYSHAFKFSKKNVPNVEFAELKNFMPKLNLGRLGAAEKAKLLDSVRKSYKKIKKSFDKNKKKIIKNSEKSMTSVERSGSKWQNYVEGNSKKQLESNKKLYETKKSEYTATYKQKRVEVDERWKEKINAVQDLVSNYQALLARASGLGDIADEKRNINRFASVGKSALTPLNMIGLVPLANEVEDASRKLDTMPLAEKNNLVGHIRERLEYLENVKWNLKTSQNKSLNNIDRMYQAGVEGFDKKYMDQVEEIQGVEQDSVDAISTSSEREMNEQYGEMNSDLESLKANSESALMRELNEIYARAEKAIESSPFEENGEGLESIDDSKSVISYSDDSQGGHIGDKESYRPITDKDAANNGLKLTNLADQRLTMSSDEDTRVARELLAAASTSNSKAEVFLPADMQGMKLGDEPPYFDVEAGKVAQDEYDSFGQSFEQETDNIIQQANDQADEIIAVQTAKAKEIEKTIEKAAARSAEEMERLGREYTQDTLQFSDERINEIVAYADSVDRVIEMAWPKATQDLSIELEGNRQLVAEYKATKASILGLLLGSIFGVMMAIPTARAAFMAYVEFSNLIWVPGGFVAAAQAIARAIAWTIVVGGIIAGAVMGIMSAFDEGQKIDLMLQKQMENKEHLEIALFNVPEYNEYKAAEKNLKGSRAAFDAELKKIFGGLDADYIGRFRKDHAKLKKLFNKYKSGSLRKDEFGQLKNLLKRFDSMENNKRFNIAMENVRINSIKMQENLEKLKNMKDKMVVVEDYHELSEGSGKWLKHDKVMSVADAFEALQITNYKIGKLQEYKILQDEYGKMVELNAKGDGFIVRDQTWHEKNLHNTNKAYNAMLKGLSDGINYVCEKISSNKTVTAIFATAMLAGLAILTRNASPLTLSVVGATVLGATGFAIGTGGFKKFISNIPKALAVAPFRFVEGFGGFILGMGQMANHTAWSFGSQDAGHAIGETVEGFLGFGVGIVEGLIGFKPGSFIHNIKKHGFAKGFKRTFANKGKKSAVYDADNNIIGIKDDVYGTGGYTFEYGVDSFGKSVGEIFMLKVSAQAGKKGAKSKSKSKSKSAGAKEGAGSWKSNTWVGRNYTKMSTNWIAPLTAKAAAATGLAKVGWTLARGAASIAVGAITAISAVVALPVYALVSAGKYALKKIIEPMGKFAEGFKNAKGAWAKFKYAAPALVVTLGVSAVVTAAVYSTSFAGDLLNNLAFIGAGVIGAGLLWKRAKNVLKNGKSMTILNNLKKAKKGTLNATTLKAISELRAQGFSLKDIAAAKIGKVARLKAFAKDFFIPTRWREAWANRKLVKAEKAALAKEAGPKAVEVGRVRKFIADATGWTTIKEFTQTLKSKITGKELKLKDGTFVKPKFADIKAQGLANAVYTLSGAKTIVGFARQMKEIFSKEIGKVSVRWTAKTAAVAGKPRLVKAALRLEAAAAKAGLVLEAGAKIVPQTIMPVLGTVMDLGLKVGSMVVIATNPEFGFALLGLSHGFHKLFLDKGSPEKQRAKNAKKLLKNRDGALSPKDAAALFEYLKHGDPNIVVEGKGQMSGREFLRQVERGMIDPALAKITKISGLKGEISFQNETIAEGVQQTFRGSLLEVINRSNTTQTLKERAAYMRQIETERLKKSSEAISDFKKLLGQEANAISDITILRKMLEAKIGKATGAELARLRVIEAKYADVSQIGTKQTRLQQLENELREIKSKKYEVDFNKPKEVEARIQRLKKMKSKSGALKTELKDLETYKKRTSEKQQIEEFLQIAEANRVVEMDPALVSETMKSIADELFARETRVNMEKIVTDVNKLKTEKNQNLLKEYTEAKMELIKEIREGKNVDITPESIVAKILKRSQLQVDSKAIGGIISAERNMGIDFALELQTRKGATIIDIVNSRLKKFRADVLDTYVLEMVMTHKVGLVKDGVKTQKALREYVQERFDARKNLVKALKEKLERTGKINELIEALEKGEKIGSVLKKMEKKLVEDVVNSLKEIVKSKELKLTDAQIRELEKAETVEKLKEAVNKLPENLKTEVQSKIKTIEEIKAGELNTLNERIAEAPEKGFSDKEKLTDESVYEVVEEFYRKRVFDKSELIVFRYSQRVDVVRERMQSETSFKERVKLRERLEQVDAEFMLVQANYNYAKSQIEVFTNTPLKTKEAKEIEDMNSKLNEVAGVKKKTIGVREWIENEFARRTKSRLEIEIDNYTKQKQVVSEMFENGTANKSHIKTLRKAMAELQAAEARISDVVLKYEKAKLTAQGIQFEGAIRELINEGIKLEAIKFKDIQSKIKTEKGKFEQQKNDAKKAIKDGGFKKKIKDFERRLKNLEKVQKELKEISELKGEFKKLLGKEKETTTFKELLDGVRDIKKTEKFKYKQAQELLKKAKKWKVDPVFGEAKLLNRYKKGLKLKVVEKVEFKKADTLKNVLEITQKRVGERKRELSIEENKLAAQEKNLKTAEENLRNVEGKVISEKINELKAQYKTRIDALGAQKKAKQAEIDLKEKNIEKLEGEQELRKQEGKASEAKIEREKAGIEAKQSEKTKLDNELKGIKQQIEIVEKIGGEKGYITYLPEIMVRERSVFSWKYNPLRKTESLLKNVFKEITDLHVQEVALEYTFKAPATLRIKGVAQTTNQLKWDAFRTQAIKWKNGKMVREVISRLENAEFEILEAKYKREKFITGESKIGRERTQFQKDVRSEAVTVTKHMNAEKTENLDVVKDDALLNAKDGAAVETLINEQTKTAEFKKNIGEALNGIGNEGGLIAESQIYAKASGAWWSPFKARTYTRKAKVNLKGEEPTKLKQKDINYKLDMSRKQQKFLTELENYYNTRKNRALDKTVEQLKALKGGKTAEIAAKLDAKITYLEGRREAASSNVKIAHQKMTKAMAEFLETGKNVGAREVLRRLDTADIIELPENYTLSKQKLETAIDRYSFYKKQKYSAETDIREFNQKDKQSDSNETVIEDAVDILQQAKRGATDANVKSELKKMAKEENFSKKSVELETGKVEGLEKSITTLEGLMGQVEVNFSIVKRRYLNRLDS
ncbi:hypothetical protein ACFL4A_03660, partial [bacterium]